MYLLFISFTYLPSVLWHCWLGGRKGIRPVKNRVVGYVICLERGADLHMAKLMLLMSLASEKSRLVLPFWYRLTQVVLEKRPLNGCCCYHEGKLADVHSPPVHPTKVAAKNNTITNHYNATNMLQLFLFLRNLWINMLHLVTDPFPIWTSFQRF